MKLVGLDHYLLHYEHAQMLLSFLIMLCVCIYVNMYVCVYTHQHIHTQHSHNICKPQCSTFQPSYRLSILTPLLRALMILMNRAEITWLFNPLNTELNPICCLLALLGAHYFLHVSRIRIKSLTLRLLMSYIYIEHPFLMFLDHTRRLTTVGKTPLDE
jgi:hypothetical protein